MNVSCFIIELEDLYKLSSLCPLVSAGSIIHRCKYGCIIVKNYRFISWYNHHEAYRPPVTSELDSRTGTPPSPNINTSNTNHWRDVGRRVTRKHTLPRSWPDDHEQLAGIFNHRQQYNNISLLRTIGTSFSRNFLDEFIWTMITRLKCESSA